MTDTDPAYEWLKNATDEELEEADRLAREAYGDKEDDDQDK